MINLLNLSTHNFKSQDSNSGLKVLLLKTSNLLFTDKYIYTEQMSKDVDYTKLHSFYSS